MKVNIKYKAGEVYIEHNGDTIMAIHLRYSFRKNGGYNITLPSNWMYNSNKSNIIMINTSHNPIESGTCILKYRGDLTIHSADIVDKTLKMQTIQLATRTGIDNAITGIIKRDDSTIANIGKETFGTETKIEEYLSSKPIPGTIKGGRVSNIETFRKRYHVINKLEYNENQETSTEIKPEVRDIMRGTGRGY